MCGVTEGSRPARKIARPRWGLLYGLVFSVLAVLGAVEILVAPGAWRTALQCGLGLGAVGTMALWVRWSREALDQQDWCACAAATMTVQVIPSCRPEPPVAPAVPPRPCTRLVDREADASLARSARR